ncbi:MAG: hypothetical protein JJT94_17280 [Bernardetiaceae bacterium]|nr:hypothetical protein [Bernardetiaceae bacterium]
MGIHSRSWQSEGYRFGFNTQEKTPEIAPDTYTAEFWQYDSRVARRWNVDPVFVEWESSYAVNRNNPIGFADPFGDSGEITIDKSNKKITISSHLVFYGTKADTHAKKAYNNIVEQWTDYSFDNGWTVSFDISMEIVDEKTVLEMANKDNGALNNYIRIEDTNRAEKVETENGDAMVSLVPELGGKSGFWLTGDIDKGNTAAHEFSHLLGLAHCPDLARNCYKAATATTAGIVIQHDIRYADIEPRIVTESAVREAIGYINRNKFEKESSWFGKTTNKIGLTNKSVYSWGNFNKNDEYSLRIYNKSGGYIMGKSFKYDKQTKQMVTGDSYEFKSKSN